MSFADISLQIFLVKYEYDHYNYVKTKAYLESLKHVLATMCLPSLRLIWRPGFRIFHNCSLKGGKRTIVKPGLHRIGRIIKYVLPTMS